MLCALDIFPRVIDNELRIKINTSGLLTLFAILFFGSLL
jgi:hypothetical protein